MADGTGGGKIYNGQNIYGAPGGGATDIRIKEASDNNWYIDDHESWEEDESLLSRIIVAAGGGGANTRMEGYGYGNGGNGGALIGQSGTTEGQSVYGLSYGYSIGTGGTQNKGGHNVSFKNEIVESEGYEAKFGSGNQADSGETSFAQSGGGGGYYGGAAAIHGGAGGGSSYISGYNGCLTHNSGYVFTDTEMIEGVRTGNGFAKITFSNF